MPPLTKKLAKKDPAALLVASRDKDSSLEMETKALQAWPNMRIVWMIRHPFDVLTSIHDRFPGKYYVEPERYVQSMRLYEKFKDLPQVRAVKYEDLVAAPDAVQKDLAAWAGLQSARTFVECHKHFESNEQTKVALHSIRPIDSASVFKWRKNPDMAAYLKDATTRTPAVLEMARYGNYDLSL